MSEELKLHALRALHKLGRTYGVPLAEEIESAIGKRVSTGALYSVLQALEAAEHVASELGEATAERGGRRKRYYEITDRGRAAFIDQLEERSGDVHAAISPLQAAI